MRDNPKVFKLLVDICLTERRAGRARMSVRMAWELVRAKHREIGGLDDHHHSRYARYIMDNVPELQGFFFIRKLPSAA